MKASLFIFIICLSYSLSAVTLCHAALILSDGQKDRCIDEKECQQMVWCFNGKDLNMIGSIWSDVVAHVHVYNDSSSKASSSMFSSHSSPNLSNLCVLSESDDSSFSIFWKKLATGISRISLSDITSSPLSIFSNLRTAFQGYPLPEQRIESSKPRMGSTFLHQLLPQSLSQALFGCTTTDCVLHFSSFGQSCIRLCPDQPNQKILTNVGIEIKVENLSNYYFVVLACGLVLYLIAPWVSKKVAFFYISGTSLGIVLSIAVLIFFISRRVNHNSTSAWSALLATLTQVTLSVSAWVMLNIEKIVMEYYDFIIGYIVISGLVSFVMIHYMVGGSVDNVSPAWQDILRWFLRLISLIMLFHATSSTSWGLIFILVAIFFPYFQLYGSHIPIKVPTNVITKTDPAYVEAPIGKSYPGQRLISEEKYQKQKVEYTQKEIDRLMKTPEFKRWMRQNHSTMNRSVEVERIDFSDDDEDQINDSD